MRREVVVNQAGCAVIIQLMLAGPLLLGPLALATIFVLVAAMRFKFHPFLALLVPACGKDQCAVAHAHIHHAIEIKPRLSSQPDQPTEKTHP